MQTPRRIDFSLFDDDLRALLNATAKIFPVEYAYIEAGTNPENYEYVKVITTGEHRLEIYNWTGATWDLIGADDRFMTWTDIRNKPTVYPPDVHTHQEIIDMFAGKADINHTHVELHSHTNKTLLDGLDQTDLDAIAQVADHEERLQLIEGGYSAGHAHANLDILNKIAYTGTANNIDLKTIADNTTALGQKADVTALAAKADVTTLNGHINNTTVHVLQTDKDTWNGKTKVTINTVQPADSSLWYKLI
jgi:hypothetical protein